MIKKKTLIKVYYSVLLFYFIYTPEIFLLIDVPLQSYVIVSCFFGYLIINFLFKISFSKQIKIFKDKKLKMLFIGIFLATFYFTIVAILTNNELRLFQNLYIIAQTTVIICFFDKLSKFGLGKFEKIELLYRIVAVQGIFSLVMLISSNFRQIALNLYYLGKTENVFISSMRIYGISGDYTFFTPVFHGLLIAVAVYLFLYENKKFIIYIPFILITTFLNGRTGLFIAMVGIILILFVYSLFYFEKIYKVILIFLTLCLSLYLVILFLKSFVNPTYLWIMSGIKEFLSFLNGGDRLGTFEVLSDMFLFPEGNKIIFGQGFRLYGNQKGFIHSDIGYVNDLFMGGLIYCFILYISEIVYIFQYSHIKEKEKKITLSLLFFLSLAISNYKGEAARMGLVLVGIIFIKYLLDQPNESFD